MVPLTNELPEAARYLREQMSRYAVGTEAIVPTAAEDETSSN